MDKSKPFPKSKDFPTHASEVRIPPQDLEAEQALLGAVIQDHDALLRIGGLIEPDYFYREANRKIYKAVLNLSEKSEPVDAITLTNELKRMGEYDAIGGLTTLMNLIERDPTAANAEYYAKIVKEKAYSRGLIRLLTNAVVDLYKDSEEGPKIAEMVMGEIVKGTGTTKDFIDPKDLAYKAIEAMMDGEVKRFLPTGFSKLDQAIGGMRIGHIGVLTGPAQHGKSTLIQGISVNLAKAGKKVIHLALEDDAENVMDRQVCLLNEIEMPVLHSSDPQIMSNLQKTAAYEKWYKLGILLGDKFHTGSEWSKLKLLFLRAIKKNKADVLLIEGGELIEVMPRFSENKHDADARMVAELDTIAQENRIAIWVIVGKGKSDETKYAGGTHAWYKIPRQYIHVKMHPDGQPYGSNKTIKNEQLKDVILIEVTKTNDRKQVKEEIWLKKQGDTFRLKEI